MHRRRFTYPYVGAKSKPTPKFAGLAGSWSWEARDPVGKKDQRTGRRKRKRSAGTRQRVIFQERALLRGIMWMIFRLCSMLLELFSCREGLAERLYLWRAEAQQNTNRMNRPTSNTRDERAGYIDLIK